jgi:hypothetical protein
MRFSPRIYIFEIIFAIEGQLVYDCFVEIVYSCRLLHLSTSILLSEINFVLDYRHADLNYYIIDYYQGILKDHAGYRKISNCSDLK